VNAYAMLIKNTVHTQLSPQLVERFIWYCSNS